MEKTLKEILDEILDEIEQELDEVLPLKQGLMDIKPLFICLVEKKIRKKRRMLLPAGYSIVESINEQQSKVETTKLVNPLVWLSVLINKVIMDTNLK